MSLGLDTALSSVTDFDGFTEKMGLGKIFGHSSPSEFAKNGHLLANSVLPDIESKYSSNPSEFLTKQSEAINYMIASYRQFLKYSSSERSKKGNKAGLDAVIEANRIFQNLSAENLSKFNLTFTTKTIVKPPSYLSSYGIMGANKDPISFTYREFYKKSSILGSLLSPLDSVIGGVSGNSGGNSVKPAASFLMPLLLVVVVFFVGKKFIK